MLTVFDFLVADFGGEKGRLYFELKLLDALMEELERAELKQRQILREIIDIKKNPLLALFKERERLGLELSAAYTKEDVDAAYRVRIYQLEKVIKKIESDIFTLKIESNALLEKCKGMSRRIYG